MEASKKQVQAINAILATSGQMEFKKDIIWNATGGRTDRSSKMTFEEAKGLLASLNLGQVFSKEESGKIRMVRYIIAMAHEMGWIKKRVILNADGHLGQLNDYTELTIWLVKYGYLKKPLNEYTYLELPKLLTQFQQGPYNSYLSH